MHDRAAANRRFPALASAGDVGADLSCQLAASGQSADARQVPGALWLVTALALAIVLAIPFFLVDVPPILDYPNHLARYFVLAHPDDPELSQMYRPRWGLMPNLGMDVLGAGLLKLTDVHTGGGFCWPSVSSRRWWA